MMLQPLKQSLAEQTPLRYVDLRRDNTVEIGWDWFILHVRMADLIALSDALELLTDELELPPAANYRLWLNGESLTFLCSDLLRFCEMVQDARQNLPRTFVRWADLDIRLEITAHDTRFSYN